MKRIIWCSVYTVLVIPVITVCAFVPTVRLLWLIANEIYDDR